MIEVRDSPARGRGVFAARPIGAGELICFDPVVEVVPRVIPGALSGLWWEWGDIAAIAFGPSGFIGDCGPGPPNATNRCLHALRRMAIVAARDIAEGEEILLDYGGLDT